MKTRFKMWWRLVGSALENAARQAGYTVEILKEKGEAAKIDVDFSRMFRGCRGDESCTRAWRSSRRLRLGIGCVEGLHAQRLVFWGYTAGRRPRNGVRHGLLRNADRCADDPRRG